MKLQEGVIAYLWGILDEVDTAGDIAKSDDQLYRALVENLQKKRWATGITTDGYTLDFSNMKVPLNENEQTTG